MNFTLFIILISLLSRASFAFAEATGDLQEDFEARMKYARAHLCSDSIQPNDTKKNRLEAAGCTDCEKAKLNQNGPGDVKEKINGVFKPIDWSDSETRAKRDLAYFRSSAFKDSFYSYTYNVSSDKKGLESSIENTKYQIDGTKMQLESKTPKTIEMQKLGSAFQAAANGEAIPPDQLEVAHSFLIKRLSGYQYSMETTELNIDQLNQKMNALSSQMSLKYKQMYEDEIANSKKNLESQKALVEGVKAAINSNDLKKALGESFQIVASSVKDTVSSQANEINAIQNHLKQYADDLVKYNKQLEALNKPVDASNPVSADQKELANVELSVGNQLYKTGNGFNTCGMSIAEMKALQSYTSNGYMNLNSGLRAGGAKAQAVQPFADEVKAALIRLRRYKGNVNRGATVPTEILKTYQPGAVITFNAFTSTAVDSGFPGGVKFVIHSRSGRFIAPLSTHESENEVLFAPETRFKVLSRTDTGASTEIVLDEVDAKTRPGTKSP